MIVQGWCQNSLAPLSCHGRSAACPISQVFFGWTWTVHKYISWLNFLSEHVFYHFAFRYGDHQIHKTPYVCVRTCVRASQPQREKEREHLVLTKHTVWLPKYFCPCWSTIIISTKHIAMFYLFCEYFFISIYNVLHEFYPRWGICIISTKQSQVPYMSEYSSYFLIFFPVSFTWTSMCLIYADLGWALMLCNKESVLTLCICSH